MRYNPQPAPCNGQLKAYAGETLLADISILVKFAINLVEFLNYLEILFFFIDCLGYRGATLRGCQAQKFLNRHFIEV